MTFRRKQYPFLPFFPYTPGRVYILVKHCSSKQLCAASVAYPPMRRMSSSSRSCNISTTHRHRLNEKHIIFIVFQFDFFLLYTPVVFICVWAAASRYSLSFRCGFFFTTHRAHTDFTCR